MEIGLMMFFMVLALIDINLKKALNFRLSFSDANYEDRIKPFVNFWV